MVYPPADASCPDCGGSLRHLGEDVSEQLDFIPASFKVIRHIRPKLACTCCGCIVQAPAPSRPIERSIAGPGLLAHVLVSKYADHLPLHRQSVIYARDGIELSRSVLPDWVGSTSGLLRPLVEAIRQHVMAAGKIHADDTPVPVLAPGNSKTKTGRLWTYVRDDRPSGSTTPPAVWFAYTPERKGIHPQRTWHALPASCKPMPMPDSTRYMKPAGLPKLPAGPMPGASSTNCIRQDLPQ
jgi:transposase